MTENVIQIKKQKKKRWEIEKVEVEMKTVKQNEWEVRLDLVAKEIYEWMYQLNVNGQFLTDSSDQFHFSTQNSEAQQLTNSNEQHSEGVDNGKNQLESAA